MKHREDDLSCGVRRSDLWSALICLACAGLGLLTILWAAEVPG